MRGEPISLIGTPVQVYPSRPVFLSAPLDADVTFAFARDCATKNPGVKPLVPVDGAPLSILAAGKTVELTDALGWVSDDRALVSFGDAIADA